MQKSAKSANTLAKRVSFQSLGLDKAMTEKDSVLTLDTSASRKSAAKVALASRNIFPDPNDECMIFSETLPELAPGSKNVLRFSNNYYFNSPPTEKLKCKSSRNGRQTPLPPSGLQSHFDLIDSGMDVDEVGAVIEEDEDDTNCQNGLSDLGNAPPLVPPSCDQMDISGEKRKATPPDLLALSQMYFERNQKAMTITRDSSASSRSMRKYHSVDSTLTLISDKPPLTVGTGRPRKLTPLVNRPAMAQDEKEISASVPGTATSRHKLHMSVNYSAGGGPSNKPTLNPITGTEEASSQAQKSRPNTLKSIGESKQQAGLRKSTYVITEPTTTTSTLAEHPVVAAEPLPLEIPMDTQG